MKFKSSLIICLSFVLSPAFLQASSQECRTSHFNLKIDLEQQMYMQPSFAVERNDSWEKIGKTQILEQPVSKESIQELQEFVDSMRQRLESFVVQTEEDKMEYKELKDELEYFEHYLDAEHVQTIGSFTDESLIAIIFHKDANGAVIRKFGVHSSLGRFLCD